VSPRNIFYYIYILTKYLVCTKALPALREMLSTPLSTVILIVNALTLVGKVWFEETMNVASQFLETISHHNMIYLIVLTTAAIVVYKNARYLMDKEHKKEKRFWKIWQISSFEVTYMLMWSLGTSMSFLTLFGAPVNLTLMVMGYNAMIFALRWFFKNRIKNSIAYAV
jgi:hypothetical protein